jgi:hypothetical protein
MGLWNMGSEVYRRARMPRCSPEAWELRASSLGDLFEAAVREAVEATRSIPVSAAELMLPTIRVRVKL